MPLSENDKEMFEQAANVAAKLKEVVTFNIGDFPCAGKAFELDGVRHVFKPNNCDLIDLEKKGKHPRRVRAKLTVYRQESFLQYMADHVTEDTNIFARVDAATGLAATAIFDYPGKQSKPAWGDHRITLQTMFSKEWKTWQGSNGNPFDQEEFVLFVEDNLPDFVKPLGADMLTMARDLEAKQEVEWKGSVRQESGDVSLSFQSNTRAGNGAVEVPSMLTLGLRVFEGGTRYQVPARLRYKLEEGALTIRYEIQRAEDVIESAMKDILAAIETATNIAPLIGATPNEV